MVIKRKYIGNDLEVDGYSLIKHGPIIQESETGNEDNKEMSIGRTFKPGSPTAEQNSEGRRFCNPFCVYLCVCVCVYVRARARARAFAFMYVCMRIYPDDGGGRHRSMLKYNLTVYVRGVGPTCTQ